MIQVHFWVRVTVTIYISSNTCSMQHLLNSSEGVDQNNLQNLPRQVHVLFYLYMAVLNLDLKTTTLKVFTLY